jgi:membrane-associated phospholipid phosphatase
LDNGKIKITGFRRIFDDNDIYFLSYLLILTVSFLLYFFYLNKGDAVQWMLLHHSVLPDFFFKWITWLGDGLTVAIIIVMFLFIQYKYVIFLATSTLFASILIQILKQLVFPENHRPVLFFLERAIAIEPIFGVSLHSHFSFPSGHAGAAFVLYTGIALITRHKLLKMVCLAIAVLVAISRVWLSQHFLVDIMAGSVIGISSSVVFWWFFNRTNWFHSDSLNKRLYFNTIPGLF